jgi:hypothetical protein
MSGFMAALPFRLPLVSADPPDPTAKRRCGQARRFGAAACPMVARARRRDQATVGSPLVTTLALCERYLLQAKNSQGRDAP